ncbi:calcium uniporter protein, mitochondrial isoform X1 [Bombus affinis]|uniref:calcium uniporter protein, mitochondrial isoform X1 n=1 Tax=Bombus affinis TaxID=309941 RepID=UPI0021B6F838|nr:calcium uniporter protein, mitochondrial isoform X1 [Bombus affinis]
MATVCCRALYVVKWYEVSRVLSVSSTLVTTKSYQNETWCKRWWHSTQRNLSSTKSNFSPRLSPILAEGMEDKSTPKEQNRTKPTKNDEVEKSLMIAENTESAVAGVIITYYRGLPKITVPLPSRKEQCVFTLKPITHTVGNFIHMLKKEDRGIDRAIVTTIDGVRIGSNNTIETLMENDFRLIINDIEYLVQPPLHHKHTMENIEKLSDVRTLIGQLYESFHVREHYATMEKHVLEELEAVRLELEPLEQKLQELDNTAAKRANIFVWVCLVLMSIQFSGLARLTWWEYSWDIMEPVTYFVNYGTTMALFIYFVLTRQEYMLPDVMNRRQLITLHKKAKKLGFDLNQYNTLKDRAYELETILKIIRGPLYEHKNRIMQQKRNRSSSSSSRSPSSSPSPNPSPSPERSFPKRGIFPQKDTSKKAIPWTDKKTRNY